MPLPKSHYIDLEPLSDKDVLDGLALMQTEVAGLTLKYEGAKGSLKEIREKRSDLERKIAAVLGAVDSDGPVYELKGGHLTTEGPAGQDELPFDREAANEGSGRGRGNAAPPRKAPPAPRGSSGRVQAPHAAPAAAGRKKPLRALGPPPEAPPSRNELARASKSARKETAAAGNAGKGIDDADDLIPAE